MMQTAIHEFLTDLRLEGRAERTIEGHDLELHRLQGWLDEAGLDWQTVSRRELQQYARLRANLGFSSRSNMFCTLRTFYRWAVEQGYVALSPAAHFKTPSKPIPLPRALSRDQVKVLLHRLAAGRTRRERRDEALVLTALYTGLRANELAMLRWPHIDLTGGVINIQISKMNKGRSVPIHKALHSVLIAWHQIQNLGDLAPVFSLDGKMFGPNRVGKIVRPYARELHLPLTIHVLRHTFATWMLRKSGNLYAVSKALGHSQVTQTQIYVSADVESIRPALDTLPDLMTW